MVVVHGKGVNSLKSVGIGSVVFVCESVLGRRRGATELSIFRTHLKCVLVYNCIYAFVYTAYAYGKCMGPLVHFTIIVVLSVHVPKRPSWS